MNFVYRQHNLSVLALDLRIKVKPFFRTAILSVPQRFASKETKESYLRKLIYYISSKA